MRDTLPQYPFNVESGFVNFNTSSHPGSHWVCYHRNKNERIYFDSYGQITLVEIQRDLETGNEFDRGKEVIVIQRKYRYRTSCEYASVRSYMLIRVEIINEQ